MGKKQSISQIIHVFVHLGMLGQGWGSKSHKHIYVLEEWEVQHKPTKNLSILEKARFSKIELTRLFLENTANYDVIFKHEELPKWPEMPRYIYFRQNTELSE